MSAPIEINKKQRTISDEFSSLSNDSKSIVLGFTDGVAPTLKITNPLYESPRRRRVDSIGYSPVTESILKFHGITTVPTSLINKNDHYRLKPKSK